VVAEAPRTVWEGNHHFPPDSLHREYFARSTATSACSWKSLARYHTVAAGGEVNQDAAWYFPKPGPLAPRIRSRVTFWNGVRIEAERQAKRHGPLGRLPAWLGGKR
jgi:uncharacterized protein (DUF427 family)